MCYWGSQLCGLYNSTYPMQITGVNSLTELTHSSTAPGSQYPFVTGSHQTKSPHGGLTTLLAME